MSTPPHQRLDREGARHIEQLIRQVLEQDEGAEPTPHTLRCVACGHPVTDERLRISIQGAHRHHCVNPLGLAFQVSCFREAPGAVAVGEPESEYSWFPGHQWRYALCGGCGEHLGWHFSGIEQFFGLIEEKLKRAE